MSPSSIKKKCLEFLNDLISNEPVNQESSQADDQRSKNTCRVKKLIQSLIDGTIEPEEFMTQLQKRFGIQPYYPISIHLFLKTSLPHVRQALWSKEMTIDGIRPPPLSAASVQTTTSTTVKTPAQGMSTRSGFSAAIQMGPGVEGRGRFIKNNTPHPISATSGYTMLTPSSFIGSSAIPAQGMPSLTGVAPRPVSVTSDNIRQSPISTIESSAAPAPGMSTSSGVTPTIQVRPASGGSSGRRSGFREYNNSLKRKLTRVREPSNKKMLLKLENKFGFYEKQVQISEDLHSKLNLKKRQNNKLQKEIDTKNAKIADVHSKWNLEKHKNDKLQKEIDTKNAVIADVQSKLKQAQDEATIRVHEVERQKKIDIDQLQMKIHSLIQKCSNMKAEMADIKSENAETVRKLNLDNQRFKLTVSMLKEENEKSQDDIQILKREKIHLIEDASKGITLERELKEAMEKIKMLEKKIEADTDAALTERGYQSE